MGASYKLYVIDGKGRESLHLDTDNIQKLRYYLSEITAQRIRNMDYCNTNKIRVARHGHDDRVVNMMECDKLIYTI